MKAAPSPKGLNVGLVGCGRISQTHLQAVDQIDDCRLLAVADSRGHVAESVANQFGCKPFSDYRKLADNVRLDAVLVCSPPNTHAEIAGAFLERGVHVLCEKPLAISSAEATALTESAKAHDCVLMMASKFRYVEDVIKAKGLLESGVLGETLLFENVFCSKVDMRDRWNSCKQVAGGGVLIDNGTHSVDIAQFLLGPIAKVQAEEGKRVQGLEVEDTCRLSLRAASGAMGAIDLSWSLHKERDSFIELFGVEGTLSIGWKSSKYRRSDTLDWIEFGSGYDKASAFTRQLQNFCGTIAGREEPLITPEDGLRSVRMIESAYRSMRMNNWVEVSQ